MSTKMNRKNMVLKGTAQAVAASQTKQVVSDTIEGLSTEDSKVFQVVIEVSGHSGTVTGVLQDSPDGSNWSDVKTVSITGDGQFEIANNVYNGTDAPMWNQARVCITTAAASGVTVDKVIVSRR